MSKFFGYSHSYININIHGAMHIFKYYCSKCRKHHKDKDVLFFEHWDYMFNGIDDKEKVVFT